MKSMTRFGIASFLGIVFCWISPSAAADPDPDWKGGDMEEIRNELKRLRAERAKVREGKAAPSDDETGIEITGMVRLDAEYRFSNKGSGDGARDLDSRLYVDLRVGDDTKDTVTGAFSGRLWWDMDGVVYDDGTGLVPPEDAQFAQYNDVENKDVTDRIYTLYVDLNRIGPFDKIRVGRQYNDGYTGGHFDGAEIYMNPWEDTDLAFYGGVPVNYWKESDENPWSTDRIAGGRITNRYIEDLSFTVDVQGSKTKTAYTGTREDYWIVLGLKYDFTDTFFIHVDENVLSGEQRELNGSLVYWNPDWKLDFSFNYTWMPSTLEDLNYLYNPYTDVMGPQQPYQLFSFMATQGLGDYFAVGAELLLRELLDTSDGSIWNQEYTRAMVSATMMDLPLEDFSATLNYQYWQANDDGTYFFGGDLRQRISRKHVVEAGAYYDLFKYSEPFFTDTMDVTTLYARWRWNFARDMNLYLKYEYENADDVIYNTIYAAFDYIF